MLTLIIIGLSVALVWIGRRYWLLRRGVGLLADAVAQGRSFLHEDNELPELHPAWRRLVSESGSLVREIARLKEQRAGQLSQLETTLGSLREGVLIVDRDNYVLLANPAVRRIFPAAKSVVGQRLELVLHSLDLLGLLETVRTSEESAQREIEFREHGRTVWIEATGAAVPGTTEQSGPWCLFVLHDITRLKELENVRKEFVANVSHELKTPITMLKGYAETLCDDDGSMSAADRLQFARTIHRHAERLSAIVEDLLTLSRLESGGAVLNLAWQGPERVVEAAIEEFRDAFAASGHELAAVCEAAGSESRIDAMRLGQVFTNLLENAQKYTPGGTRVVVGVRSVSRSAEVEYWVSDNGPGIPPADLPRIFERFYRVEKGRSRDKGGTGLGLSIVKHIVQLHGGQVTAESRLGQGTRISFRLPARSPLVPEPQPAASGDRLANAP
ncbi:MAG: PAS domain S-box protein [Opitutaceae bacterium]|nr:PAS domain S-box protein [Opitutaceae bacterium]